MTTDPTPDAEPAVKPQVIDLQAEDVTVAETPPKAAPSEPTHPPTPPRRKSSGRLRWIAVALVVGLAGGAWLYRDLLSTYLPTNEMTALSSRVGSLEAGAKTMGDQLQAVAASADQASKTVAALDGAVKDAAAGVASVRSGLADFDRRLAATDKSLQSLKSDIDKLRAAVSSGTGGGGPADATALAAIGQRLDGLEKDVASLKAGQGTGADTAMVAALRQALSDIQAKIAAGVPYRDELDRILRMVPSVGGNDGLAAHADEGLPAARGLAQELRNDIPTLPGPAPAVADQGGYLSGLWNALTSVVTIRDVGETDWQAVARTAADLADKNDLAAAVAGIDQAQGAPPAALSRWRERAAARLKLEQAVQELVKSVDLVIAAKGGGQ